MRWWIGGVALAGCVESGSDCMEEFSAANGYDFESDGEVAVAPTGGTAPEPPSALASAQAECEAEAAPDCDVNVTRAAAECLAEEDGLAPGLEAWQVTLVYHHTHDAIVWNVANTVEQTGATATGETVTIHAGTGEVLARSEWQAMP